MKNSKNSIIITSPRRKGGGVYQFVQSIYTHFSCDVLVVYRGKAESEPFFLRFLRAIASYVDLIIQILRKRPKYVLINSSLSKQCLIRDGSFIRLAKLFKTQPVLVIHGFQNEALRHKWLLRNSYFKADPIFLLAKSFADDMISAGYKGTIKTQFNPVQFQLLEKMQHKNLTSAVDSILFIGRIEENKGIMIALRVYEEYKKINKNARFTVAGTGNALPQAKKFVIDRNIENVEFLGFVSGTEKENVYFEADLMIFPTSHKEGLPITILEAMAAGVIVITRPVAGIVDLFEAKDFGALTTSFDPSDYLDLLEGLIAENRIKEIKQSNRGFAIANFHPKSIVASIEDTISAQRRSL